MVLSFLMNASYWLHIWVWIHRSVALNWDAFGDVNGHENKNNVICFINLFEWAFCEKKKKFGYSCVYLWRTRKMDMLNKQSIFPDKLLEHAQKKMAKRSEHILWMKLNSQLANSLNASVSCLFCIHKFILRLCFQLGIWRLTHEMHKRTATFCVDTKRMQKVSRICD